MNEVEEWFIDKFVSEQDKLVECSREKGARICKYPMKTYIYSGEVILPASSWIEKLKTKWKRKARNEEQIRVLLVNV